MDGTERTCRTLAVGFFDGVHLGHQRIIARADAVLTFRNHPLSVLAPDRAPPLLMSADERIALLRTEGTDMHRPVRALRFTAAFAARSPERFIVSLRRDYPLLETICCGANWRFGAKGAGTPDILRAAGFKVKIVPYVRRKGAPISSTRIRETLAVGDVAEAAAMLGRPFVASGRIVHGKGLGKTLGAPTLNVLPPGNQPFPLRFGVYEVETPFGRGIANYGTAPTLRGRAWCRPLLEVHLLDGARVPSGGTLSVAFRKFVRPERTFADLASLRLQIAADLAAVR